MKSIIPDDRIIRDAEGTWWFLQANGTRQRARVLTCPTCADPFTTYPSGDTTYCSPDCRRAACRRCGVSFRPGGANSRYCSETCKRGTAECLECQKRFVIGKKAAGKYCSKECFYESQVPTGTVTPGFGGYTMTKVPKGTPGTRKSKSQRRWMFTHRYVMQQVLGRPLLQSEEVHHINGRRDDNRPENLELWKKSHPAGVRAADYHCPGCRCHEAGFVCD